MSFKLPSVGELESAVVVSIILAFAYAAYKTYQGAASAAQSVSNTIDSAADSVKSGVAAVGAARESAESWTSDAMELILDPQSFFAARMPAGYTGPLSQQKHFDDLSNQNSHPSDDTGESFAPQGDFSDQLEYTTQ